MKTYKLGARAKAAIAMAFQVALMDSVNPDVEDPQDIEDILDSFHVVVDGDEIVILNPPKLRLPEGGLEDLADQLEPMN